ncbi:hypothetical protein ABBQ32_000825 [Trebouxia sp. C0010 RCD-2024]
MLSAADCLSYQLLPAASGCRRILAVLSQVVPAAMQPLPHHPSGCPANLVECHPYFRNEGLLQWCKARHIHVTAYSPLGSPDSASMFRRKAPLLLQDPTVTALADKWSCSPAQGASDVAAAWPFRVLPTNVSRAYQGHMDTMSWASALITTTSCAAY